MKNTNEITNEKYTPKEICMANNISKFLNNKANALIIV